MILVAAGDSFIWGSELADSLNDYSRSTFPALLAEQASMEYQCAAYPGNANNAISRMAIDKICNIKSDKFLLVQWTYPQRSEFRFMDGWASINSWHTTHKDFSEVYFKYAGNTEYYEIYSVLKEIVFLQQYCHINNIPYMFMTADNTFFCHENYLRSRDSSLENLYSQINWNNWFWFPSALELNETSAPRGFYQWAIENKYTVGMEGHPLEKAHNDAAMLIKEKFNEMVTKHN
jgi:hypothetical protein